MGSLSGLGIGLSFLFGCVLMGFAAELYYLLWRKKRTATNNSIERSPFFYCWEKPISCNNYIQRLSSNPQEDAAVVGDLEIGKGYGGGVDAELMRIHGLCGPPRFLFTIKEESKEDLESARSSRKGSRSKSLGGAGDLVFAVDGATTPMSSSPIVKNRSYLPLDSSYGNRGCENPLFESLSENRLRSSPPPKFKFLKDAEDKLIKRLLMEQAERKRCSKVDEERTNSDGDGNNNNNLSLASNNSQQQVNDLKLKKSSVE